MSHRLFAAVALLLASCSSFAIGEARAQERIQPVRETKLLFLPSDSPAPVLALSASGSTLAVAEAPVAGDAPQIPAERGRFKFSPSRQVLPLYISTAVMQALDVHSTLQVLHRGGGEGNPMLQGLVKHEAAFIAAKAAVAAGTMYAASRIAKRSKVGAIITLVGLNSVYAFVVSHNYKLAHEMR